MTHSLSIRQDRINGRQLGTLLLVSLLAVLWPTGALLAQGCASAGAVQLKSEVRVTAQERAWVASLPAQRIGVLRNAAPLVGRGPLAGAYSGISIDVFCLIAGKLGLRYQFIDSGGDFAPLLQAVQQGELDMLIPLSRQVDREPFGLFTRPYFTSHYVVISLKGKPHTLESLAELPGFRIGVIEQTSLARDLASIVPAENLVSLPLTNGKGPLYRALRDGEVDVLVMNKEIFTEDRYRDELFDMEVAQILTQFPRKYGFYFSRSKDHERLVELFDRYLMQIDASAAALRHEVGERRLIERYLHQQDHLLLQQALTAVSGLAMLLLLAYFLHYRRLSKRLKATHRRVLEQQTDLLEANQQLEHMSMTDGLTGLANRRRFDERLALEFSRHKRTRRPLSVLMVDLDHFKQVNDQLGHAMGDDYLRQVASTLKSLCRRPTDLVARYGGEEVICLLPETAHAEAALIAENMREAVADLSLPNPGAPEGVLTLSMGVATQNELHGTPESLLVEADARLYQAKRGGRNRVCSG
jgi:diguanylate cyclase (GGDEF)-like protein